MHRLQVRRALIIGRKSAPSLAWVPDAAPQHRSPGRRMLKHLARRAPTATPHLWSKMAAPVAAMSTGASDARTTHKHTNRLVNEESPYLLQHAHNPVSHASYGTRLARDQAVAWPRQTIFLIHLSRSDRRGHWRRRRASPTFRPPAQCLWSSSSGHPPPPSQVDWHPWGEEAFAKAAAEDKLIFLSVGYATCHCT